MQPRIQTAVTVCAHHWRIAPPAGAYSLGTCAKCGEQRQFPNSSDVTGFGYGRTKPKPME